MLDHHFEGLVEVAGVVFALDFALAGVEDCQALDLDLFGDRVVHVDRRSVWARGVLEAEDGVVAYVFEQRDGVFEVLVGFAGEADDDVAGERDVALGGFGPGDAFEVPVASVFALHRAQDVGAAGLHG